MENPQDKPPKAEPTRSELEILQLIWQFGPSTVRTINDALNQQRVVNYTTTLKLMQIMIDKGLLLKDESQMKHVYRSAQAEDQTKGLLVDNFVNTLYQGSASKLVMQLLGNKKMSPEELQAIKKLLE